MCNHEERKTIETRLGAFLTLQESGLENSYINSNIKHYADRYHEMTGDWYRRTCPKGSKNE